MAASTSRRVWFGLACVAAALLGVGLIGEIVLRAWAAVERAGGGTLEQRLERSRRTAPDRTGGDFDLGGLVQASPFPDIVYELKPNLAGTFRRKRFSTNSLGMRDAEYAVRKPAGTCRIAGLGDSIMFGWGVHQEEPYPAVLAERLNRRAGGERRFEVLNFAVPGYNTTQEIATFEHKALAFEPDLVVIQFVDNDYGVPLFMQRPREVWTFRHSYFLDFVVRRVRDLVAAENDGLLGCRLENVEGQERERVLAQYRFMLGEAGFRRAMDRLARLTGERAIPVIVLQGSVTARQQAVAADVAREHGFSLVSLKPYTDAFVKRHGIEDTPRARRGALWVAARDHHPNALAHTIYVEALLDELNRMGFIRAEQETTPRGTAAAGGNNGRP